ncbi:MAG: carbamoyltransferase HypF [Streptosporangiales bacterium]|nr:carbamoyltransferase HypF [Streptosporangiales bacterium]
MRVRVEGIVQGVGFRPFVYALAVRHGLAGCVGNDASGVFIEAEGSSAELARFRAAVEREAPPLAMIERVSDEAIEPVGQTEFVIASSRGGGQRATLISPDTATCVDCLRELFDPADRRFRYPFINCTNCGPRFTIVRDVPYDRPFTTMATFPMCADCAREYHDPADRRFHAQPVCCPACGPSLRLVDARAKPIEGEPIARTAGLLADGLVVAVKGLGGYHLAADAESEAAVAALRSRKHREDKPFAVMVGDADAARRLCAVDEVEERVLAGPRRPIVLLRRRPDAPLAESVAPGNRFVGLMLPYTPPHHLLAREFGRPFVLTSGNVSDEPIAYDDEDAFGRLSGIADAFLFHDRPIHIRTDDSVTRVFRGRELPVRRSRGYVPQPLRLARASRRPVLACGAELKNTFCLAKGGYAFISHHIGDLENYETLRSFTEGIEHFRRLFDIRPEICAYDLHPEYLSTKYANDLAGAELVAELVGVQHHHAHVVSCLADNGEAGPVIGVAFDGLGYGTDGTLWGGEFLAADLAGFQRLGFFEPVPMPGGAAAIKQPWRMAAAYLDAAYDGAPPEDLAVVERNAARWEKVTAVARQGVNSPATSSAGRLFDAVASLVGVRDVINYEGQAAVELEQRADAGEWAAYRAGITGGATSGDPFRVRGADTVRAVVEDLRAGVPVETIAARFHRGMAAVIVAGCERIREATGLSTVALSGGVFQNLLLLEAAANGLVEQGFRVLLHHRVPPNDGGVSLGQVAVAGTRDRAS